MIYCVVPQALAGELYEKLVDYYRDDPNVEVIVDRRRSGGVAGQKSGGGGQANERRRKRIPGTFPPIEPAKE